MILPSPFRPTVYSFSNGLTQPWTFLPMGSCVPFVFPWASLAHLLALGFLGPFTNFVFPWAFTDFIGLLWPNTSYSSWGFMGLPSIPYSLCLHYFGPTAAHSYFFFTSHTAHGFATYYFSLFRLFWAYLLSQSPFTYFMDPLFLPLGLNGFCSLSFANFSVLFGWASFLTFGFHKKKKTLNNAQQ